MNLSDGDGGGFLAIVPSLPGCMSDGETREEALENVQDAIKCWIETAKELGRNIPEADEYKTKEDFSGKLTLRIPKMLRKILSEQADKEGCSINQLITTYILLGIGNEFGKGEVKNEVYISLDKSLIFAEKLARRKWESRETNNIYRDVKLDFDKMDCIDFTSKINK